MKKFVAFLMLCVLTACGSNSFHNVTGRGLDKTRPDELTQRRIVLVYPYTQERLDLVYFHDGAYDQTAFKKIRVLMRDRHSDTVGPIDPELIDYMVDIRTRLGLPANVPFQILSGYRTPATNARLALINGNVAKESLHMHGWAVDFRIDSVNGQAICDIAQTMQRGGVAFYPKDNHVHVDLGNIRTWQQR